MREPFLISATFPTTLFRAPNFMRSSKEKIPSNTPELGQQTKQGDDTRSGDQLAKAENFAPAELERPAGSARLLEHPRHGLCNVVDMHRLEPGASAADQGDGGRAADEPGE
jgi:hypothetical protein